MLRPAFCARYGQALRNDLSIKAQPSVRAAQPNRAELLGVSVDPIALDTQIMREGGGIDIARLGRVAL